MSEPQEDQIRNLLPELQKSWDCPACTFSNHPELSACQKCLTNKIFLVPSLGEFQEKRQNVGPGCFLCFGVLEMDTKCLGCYGVKDYDWYRVNGNQDQAVVRVEKKKQKKQNKTPTLQKHFTKYNPIQLDIQSKLAPKQYCPFCSQSFPWEHYEFHTASCQSRLAYLSPMNPDFSHCSQAQINTILYMNDKSEKYHWLAEKELRQKVRNLGYGAEEVENLHHFITNSAQIIIHANLSRCVKFFVKDTHYRSQFETNTSRGTLSRDCRTKWENRIFDYLHEGVTDFQRVKYGTINLTSDPKGVKSCNPYGKSYFVLRRQIRSRCTFTQNDSSGSKFIGTLPFSSHILNTFTDQELKATIQASYGISSDSTFMKLYKEIQIHGPVEFGRDIEKLWVCQSEVRNVGVRRMVEEFCEGNGIQWEVFEDRDREKKVTKKIIRKSERIGAKGKKNRQRVEDIVEEKMEDEPATDGRIAEGKSLSTMQ